MTARPRPLTQTQYDAGDAFVHRWQGADFTWNARGGPEGGTDCWGLACAFARDVLGVEMTDWSRADHSRGWVARVIAREAKAYPRYHRPADGRVVLAQRGGQAHHIGIYWRGGVLHAAEGRGVVWERLAEFAGRHPDHVFLEFPVHAPSQPPRQQSELAL